MVRETSIEAYHYVKDSGILSEAKWLIYETLYAHGPMTVTECFKKIESLGKKINYNTRTRFGELRDMALLRELGTRSCSVTGMNVILWDVTASLPRDLSTTKVSGPTKEEIGEAVAELRSLFDDLRKQKKPSFSPALLKVCGWLAKKAQN